MKSKQYDSKAKLKSYHIILISCFLCLIFILNSNYVNEKRTAVKLEKENTPKVLVMHTHTSESYMDKDQGFYYKK